MVRAGWRRGWMCDVCGVVWRGEGGMDGRNAMFRGDSTTTQSKKKKKNRVLQPGHAIELEKHGTGEREVSNKNLRGRAAGRNRKTESKKKEEKKPNGGAAAGW